MVFDLTFDDANQKAVNKAMDALSELQAHTKEDPHRLNYHFMSPAAWINDPNGLILFRDEYHMFYQIHPYSASNGPKHWGHAKSKDLIHWEHLPIVLAPVESYEKHGCFSGTAVNDNGVFTLIYTGNAFENNTINQVQCIAVSEDGIVFRKYENNPVIPNYPTDGSRDFRDPKVWKKEDLWYMAVGSGKEGIGSALLYSSKDLRTWSYIGVMARSRYPDEGAVWNCPDFFSLNGKDILVVSPGVWRENMKHVRKTMYYIGHMDYQTGVFTPEADGNLDYGDEFYAPQTWIDDQGRIILIGWMDIWFNSMPTQAYNWAGAMTIPREVFMLPDGKLGFRPIEELKALRQQHCRYDSLLVNSQSNHLFSISGDSLELIIEFDLQHCSASQFGIQLRHSEDYSQKTVIRYEPAAHTLIVDRSRSGKGADHSNSCLLLPMMDNKIKLHVLLDRSSLEVFANDGQAVLTNRIYPDKNSLGLSLFTSDGTVRVLSADVWQLAAIT